MTYHDVSINLNADSLKILGEHYAEPVWCPLCGGSGTAQVTLSRVKPRKYCVRCYCKDCHKKWRKNISQRMIELLGIIDQLEILFLPQT